MVRKVTVSESGKLLLVYDDAGLLAYDMLMSEPVQEEFKTRLAKFAGKQVEFEAKLDDGPIDKKYQDPIEAFAQNVGFDVEEE